MIPLLNRPTFSRPLLTPGHTDRQTFPHAETGQAWISCSAMHNLRICKKMQEVRFPQLRLRPSPALFSPSGCSSSSSFARSKPPRSTPGFNSKRGLEHSGMFSCGEEVSTRNTRVKRGLLERKKARVGLASGLRKGGGLFALHEP